MPRYRLDMRNGPTTAADTQCVEVDQDADAMDLAQIALLSTADYRRAEVYRGHAFIGAVERDRETTWGESLGRHHGT